MQAATAMRAARLTARDLFETAEILYALKRFPHAAALATLAIEEAAKLPIIQAIFLGFSGERSRLWKSYRQHRAKTLFLNPAIEARIRTVFPAIPHDEAKDIAQRGPSPQFLEEDKQRALYSDCLLVANEFVCHLPRNADWRERAWERLCEAQALVLGLRDFPPDELGIWQKHAQEVQARGGELRSMLITLHRELVEKGYLKEGSWASLLADLETDTT